MSNVFAGGSPTTRRPLSPVFALGVAAGVVLTGLVVVAVYPRATSPARPLSVNQSPVPPDVQQWGAIYEEIRRIPVDVQAPAELPGGHRLTSLSVWRPGWYGTGTVWHWVFSDGAGGWIHATADPTSRHKVGSDESSEEAGVGAVRILGDGDLATLEWDTPGYALQVVAGGVGLEELKRLAAGITVPDEPSMITDQAPELTVVPPGFTLVARRDGVASTVGPGEAGWRAGYLLKDGEGRTVTITAAEGRGFPFAELYELAPALRAQIRGYWGLLFDHPGASPVSRTTTRSRLVWFEEGSMLEATSNRLAAAELLTLVNELDLTVRN